MHQKIQKRLFVFEIIASQLASLYFLYKEQDTCHQQQMFQQAVPRYGMSVKQTFSNSFASAVINKYDKGALVEISTVFVHVYNVACGWVL